MVQKKVLLISTGGTISSVKSESQIGAFPTLGSNDFVTAIKPYLGRSDVSFEVLDFSKVPGLALSLNDLLSLSKAIESSVQRKDIDGIIVSIGTAGIEEASYFCDIYYKGEKPVVFTGAMRNPSGPSSDMTINLRDSVLIAVDDRLKNFGVVVAMNGEIHSAIDATKVNSTLISAIKSVNTGPLGYTLENNVYLLSPVNYRREKTHLQPNAMVDDDVPVIKCLLGMKDDIVDTLLFKTKNSGAVFEVQASGQVTESIATMLEKYIRTTGRNVVITSRTRSGPMRANTYGYIGGDIHLQKIGALMAHFITAEKARIKLVLAISSGLSGKAIKELFAA